MARYIYFEHYSADGGKLGLSDKVFSQLAKHSIKTIKEIVRDKNTIVQAAIKNNTVNYKIVVYVKKGINKDIIKDKLEERITNSLLLTCETVPVEMNIKVVEKSIEA